MGSVLNYGQTAAAARNGYGMKLYVCRNDGMKLYVYRNAHFTYAVERPPTFPEATRAARATGPRCSTMV